MLKKHAPVNAQPESLNCDFELAAINAFRKTFGFDKDIHGCFFHLSQALYRRVQKHCKASDWLDEEFTLAFRRIQALAFLPERFVVEAFEFIKSSCPRNFVKIASYFERTYIGKLIKRSNRKKARFPISFWNVFKRVKDDLPRTNNQVESWHNKIQADSRKHLTVETGIFILNKFY